MKKKMKMVICLHIKEVTLMMLLYLLEIIKKIDVKLIMSLLDKPIDSL